MPRAASSVKLICGLLGSDPDLLRRARQQLAKSFGPVELASELWPFAQTDYYEAQMGRGLQRQFLAFERLVRPDDLAEQKQISNAIETQMSEECQGLDILRPVNLDPGYIDLGKLVLATTKDRAHRIYIGSGVYAEVTLQWTAGSWQGWGWTYPDYLQPQYHAFFAQVRARLHAQRRGHADAPEPPP